jgi:O-antigen ligase
VIVPRPSSRVKFGVGGGDILAATSSTPRPVTSVPALDSPHDRLPGRPPAVLTRVSWLLAAIVAFTLVGSAVQVPMPWGARGLLMGFMVLSLVRPAAALAVAAAVTPIVAWWGRTWAGQVLWAELIVVAFALPYALRMSFEQTRAPRSRVHWPAFALAAVVVSAIVVDFSVIHLRLGPDAARFIGEHLWHRYFTDDLQSAVHAGLLLLEGLLLLVAAERIASGEPAWKRRLAAAVVSGAAAAGVLNVYRLVISARRTDGFWGMLTEYLATIRLNEAFQDANAAGSLFIAALFLTMGLAWSATRAGRAVWVAAAVAIGSGLWISGSRVAIMAGFATAAAGVVVILARKRIRRATLAAVGAIAIAGAISVIYLPARGTQKSSSVAMEVRSGLARVAIRMVAERPFTGIGLNEFYRRSGEYASPELLALFPRARNENAHNNFLQIAAELGVVGLGAFIWILAASLDSARSNVSTWLDSGLLLALTAFLLTCVGGHPLLIPEAAYPFWILLGVAAAGSPEREAPGSHWRMHRAVALSIAAAMLLSLPMRAIQQRRAAELEHVGIGVGSWQISEDGTRFRWAGSRAVVFVPGDYPGFKLRVGAAPGSPVQVELRLDGRIANVITVTPPLWRDVTVVLPPDRTGATYRRLELSGTAADGQDVRLMVGKVEPIGAPR